MLSNLATSEPHASWIIVWVRLIHVEQAQPHQVKSCYTKLLRLEILARTQRFGSQLMLKPIL